MINPNVLITGLNGMLGQQLAQHLPQHGITIAGATSRQFNLLETLDNLKEKIDAIPTLDAIIHAAAYTNVDGAEADADLAMAVNKEGTQKMALLAKYRDVPLIYISTDYVFDGEKNIPYTPQDKPNPINTYGLSKYYGELMVTEHLDKFFILRTSWVYGEHKNNFVQFVLQSAKNGQKMRIFSDQTGSPTWTGSMVPLIVNALGSEAYGTYHAADRGIISRFEQAKIICDMAGLGSDNIEPVTTASMNLKAQRPRFSALDPGTLPTTDWREALTHYLNAMSLSKV